MRIDTKTFRFTDSGTLGSRALMIGAIGLAASAAGYFVNQDQFFHSYLTAFVFWVTLGLGALFFTLIHHLVDAEWSVAIRRVMETTMVTLPMMAIFFLPIVFGMHDLFEWSLADVVAGDHLLQGKAPYLNPMFFFARTAGYFLVWFLLTRALYGRSIKQDTSNEKGQTVRMRQISAPGMVLFGFTLTYAAFDWLMSLTPHWYSTIFGVYIFVGALLASLAFFTLILLYMRGKGVLADKVTVEHYHDLGKLIFAFTIFWAYIGFSQYFLIWYGNIPEETMFFHTRWAGSWKWVSMLLIGGHFLLPFALLLTRAAKRSLKVLAFAGFWMLFIHWVDIYWVVLPTMGAHGAEPSHGFSLSWMDLSTMVGIGGMFIWMFWKRYTSQPAVPVNDPKLEASFNFTNG